MSRPFLPLLCALSLVACAEKAQLAPSAEIGPDPALPAPTKGVADRRPGGGLYGRPSRISTKQIFGRKR